MFCPQTLLCCNPVGVVGGGGGGDGRRHLWRVVVGTRAFVHVRVVFAFG